MDNDLVLFEFIGRLNEPKGWLRKLWETVHADSVVVIMTSPKRDRHYIQAHIGER
jgi:hypothetical protein